MNLPTTSLRSLIFANEAYNALLLSHNMQDFPQIQVPQIYESYSTSKVITMSFIDGVKITEFAGQEEAAPDRAQLAQVFTEAMIRQVMIDGFFHADPHPGNLLVDRRTNQIIFLDLGMMGKLSQEQRLVILDLIWSLNEGDSQHVANLVLQLTTLAQAIDRVAFEQDVDRMVKRHLVFAQSTPRLSVISQEVFDLMFRYRLRLEQELTLAFKALMQAEETVHTLAPQLSMFDGSVEAVKQVIGEQLVPEVISARLKKQATRSAKNIVLHLPAWQKSGSKMVGATGKRPFRHSSRG